MKLLEGTQGIGVVLCETQKAAESVIEAFIQTNNNILVQEYIREANGADIRCLVVNGKVVAAMRRQAQPGEFRSNLHRGGTAEAIEITPEERATAVQAAKIMGLDVAGWISCVAPVARWCWRSTPPPDCKGWKPPPARMWPARSSSSSNSRRAARINRRSEPQACICQIETGRPRAPCCYLAGGLAVPLLPHPNPLPKGEGTVRQ